MLRGAHSVAMTDDDAIDWKVSLALVDRSCLLKARKNRQTRQSDTANFSGLDGKKRRKLKCEEGRSIYGNGCRCKD